MLYILLDFDVEHVPEEVKKFIKRSAINAYTITASIYRLQAYDSVIVDIILLDLLIFMLKGKILTDFTNISLLCKLKKNMMIFQTALKMGVVNYMYPHLNVQQQF